MDARLLRRSRALVALVAVLAAAFAGAPAGADDEAGACHPIAIPANNVPMSRAFGIGPCPGVRPGAIVETAKGYCTLNFLFRGTDGKRYIGTAGHCVLGDGLWSEDAGEEVWRRRGPWAFDAAGNPIGRFVYAIQQDPKDFALIKLRKRVDASAAMCEFGGPVRMSKTRTPSLLHYYGNGALFGEVVPARTATATSMANPDHIYAHGAIAPGDSGAGVLGEDGSALGVIVTFGVHFGGLRDVGAIGITRLAPQLRRAEERLGVGLTLQTAELAP